MNWRVWAFEFPEAGCLDLVKSHKIAENQRTKRTEASRKAQLKYGEKKACSLSNAQTLRQNATGQVWVSSICNQAVPNWSKHPPVNSGNRNDVNSSKMPPNTQKGEIEQSNDQKVIKLIFFDQRTDSPTNLCMCEQKIRGGSTDRVIILVVLKSPTRNKEFVNSKAERIQKF